jgi:hypothetical protein
MHGTENLKFTAGVGNPWGTYEFPCILEYYYGAARTHERKIDLFSILCFVCQILFCNVCWIKEDKAKLKGP